MKHARFFDHFEKLIYYFDKKQFFFLKMQGGEKSKLKRNVVYIFFKRHLPYTRPHRKQSKREVTGLKYFPAVFRGWLWWCEHRIVQHCLYFFVVKDLHDSKFLCRS